MEYKLLSEDGTKVLKKPHTFISEGTLRWVEYQEWLTEGNFPEPQYTLEKIRKNQLCVIRSAFLIAPKSGLTTSLGIKVDCKREDKDNFQELLNYCTRKSLAGTSIRLHNNDFAEVSVADLQTIINEIQEYGLTLYQRKWAKEAAIEQAATEEQIKAVTWDSVE